MADDTVKKRRALFAKKIRELRKQKNLSQLDLELASGIDRTQISRIERGEKSIELDTVFKLADGLDVDAMELFNFFNRTILQA